ncbi:MAG: pyruvate, phosphate dikinase [Gordonia sp. (in: high G+C Gram-positive bacteria)]
MTANVIDPAILRITDLDHEPPRNLVGGKAWSLWRMTNLGLRVPPAFVITTRSCADYFARGRRLPDGLFDEIASGISYLEEQTGRTFGTGSHPLLVSVRSGAAVSMPGMMDTILNLGINPHTEAALAAETARPDFAADVHRRFCALYGKLVAGCIDDLEDLTDTAAVRTAIAQETGVQVPCDPLHALRQAVTAVFDSSQSRRAKAYRAHYGIPDDLGTAVTVQAMVFGNLDENSGTGVLFTRNPLTGERAPYGEYLPRGQGEDVVSGRVTPRPLSWLAQRSPQLHHELISAAERLDTEGRDAQDVEFTVQQGVLYLLQSRPAKRTAQAAVRIAAALVAEGAIEPREACERVTADQIRHLLRPSIDADAIGAAVPLATGVSASPGYAVGRVVLSADEAQQQPGTILVRTSTSPEDVHGMIAAAAVVTENGGATSHAAVVSRALDTPCVVGCGPGTASSLAGKLVTVDATGARVFDGEIAGRAVTIDADPDLASLLRWARDNAPIQVVTPDEYGDTADVFDSDTVIGTGALDLVIAPGTRTVTGAYFDTDPGVAAALDAGVSTIVTRHRLPALLAALAHRKATR